METIKVDLTQVKAKDLEGQLIPVNVGRTVGNVLYTHATTLDMDMLSRKLYNGEPVELSMQELNVIEQIVLSDHTPIFLFLKKALQNYFKTLKEQSHVKDDK